MIFNVVLSLQDMAIERIATFVYYHKDTERMLEQEIDHLFQNRTNCRKRRDLFKSIEKMDLFKGKGKKSLRQKLLPPSLQAKVYQMIPAIHMEAEYWINDHKDIFKLSSSDCYRSFKHSLCWKSDGRIDRLKVAKKLSRDETIETRTRFKLACTYFLEEEVLALWRGGEDANLQSLVWVGSNVPTRFWITYLRKKTLTKESWDSIFIEKFDYRHFSFACKVRISCFFPFLSPKNKRKYFGIFWDLSYIHHDDVRLCIQLMEDDDRDLFFRTDPSSILVALLDWPYVPLFVDTARELCRYMNLQKTEIVLRHIFDKIMLGLGYFDYADIFKEFWNILPVSCKVMNKRDEIYKLIEETLKYNSETSRMSLPDTLERRLGLQNKTNFFNECSFIYFCD